MDNNQTRDTESDAKIYEAAMKGKLDGLRVTACLEFRTPQGDNILHIALRYRNVVFMSRFLREAGSSGTHFVKQLCPLLFQGNSMNETPFHTAVRAGYINIVKKFVKYVKSCDHQEDSSLLEQGLGDGGQSNGGTHSCPPWQIRNSVDDDTVLHVAIRRGRQHQDIALYLLEEVDSNLATSVNKAGESPLYLAAENGCFLVLQKIMSLDETVTTYGVRGPYGRNPLHAAIMISDASKVWEHLIQKRPQFMLEQDDKGRTPLHLAVEYEHEKAVKLLLDQGDITKAAAIMHDNKGFTPLLTAATKGNISIIKRIIARCPMSTTICHKTNRRNMIHLLGNIEFLHEINKFLQLH